MTLPQMLDDKVPADHFIEETLATTQLAKLDINADNMRDFLQTGRPEREPQEQIIFDYHQLLVNNQHSIITSEHLTSLSTQANWRQGDANVLDQNVVLFTAPPSSSVVQGVEQILTFANQDENTEEAYLPSIVKAIILHFMICYLRPFEEGNGRSARALFYWQMQRAGYQHMAAISLSAELLAQRDDYYRAFLFTESDANDLTYFIMQQLNSLQHAIENFQQQRLAQQAKMAMLPSTLTHRQRHILCEMKSKPQQQYWVARYQQRMQITYETSRTDLRKLAKQGLLKKFKVGKAFVYQAADNDEVQPNNQQQAG
jgi:Fic family protein